MLAVPVAVFAATFLPFLREGVAGIVQNVLLYRGYDNAPLWRLLLPSGVLAVVSPTMLFLAVLTVSGLLLHHRTRVDSLLIYQLVLVAFSPTVANQSLAVPAAAMAVFPNALFGVFVAMASVHLLIHHEGLNLEVVQRLVPAAAVGYTAQVLVLLAGLAWMLFGARLRDLVARRLPRHPANGTT